jgi:heme exporter protein B
MMPIFKVLAVTIQSDLQQALRKPQQIVNPLLFFIIIVSLFPLGISSENAFLKQIAPGIIWIAALVATLVSLDKLFKQDLLDGTLDQLILSPYPLSLFILAKVFAHWLLTGLPLILLSPLLGLMLQLPHSAILALIFSLLLGTPILSLLGSVALALTVGLPNGSILLSLILLPLYVPVLVFGTSTILAALTGLPIAGNIALLAAFFVLALTLAPLASAAALRVGITTL